MLPLCHGTPIRDRVDQNFYVAGAATGVSFCRRRLGDRCRFPREQGRLRCRHGCGLIPHLDRHPVAITIFLIAGGNQCPGSGE
jgi:hypothetical protein